MIDLDDLRLFRALRLTGSLAGAGRMLDLTTAAMSIRLKKLEERIGTILVLRGARGVSFTDEGERLLREAGELLERIEALPALVSGSAHSMAGTLKIQAPFGFGRQHVAPIVSDFHRMYPRIQVLLHLSDRPLVDTTGMDLVIHIGDVKESSWIAHVLAPNRRILCASPTYLQRSKPVSHPSDLSAHECLCIRENDEDSTRWHFTAVRDAKLPDSRRSIRVQVRGSLASNDGEVVTRWAQSGMGIMARSEWAAAPLIANSELVHVLPLWELVPAPVLGLAPVRTAASGRLRAFLEFSKRALHPVPWR
ncbi:LysR family transcriptional regulator [Variovorax sp. J22P271]|uniref:LysR family transcriptional regulator n=1 Tax=Variovorax davisae TaxID=3053515 RepID=UPI002577C6AD|nr:LysR family transcriptional regulator [Variovorax sp. J22P271]MDM0032473.1 LysR family transcriptional regulator [Variovorax sp. J22P271]